MSLGTVLGLITVVLLTLFLGIVVWAYGIKKPKDFDQIARVPLERGEEQP